jgi:hypothetical protein
MSDSLGDCHQTIRVLSEKQNGLEQRITVQQDFITPECCGSETFQNDLVYDEEFCTISCPSSQCAIESLEGFMSCSPERNGHSIHARIYLHNTNIAEPMPCEQCCSSIRLAPDRATDTIQALVAGAVPEGYERASTGTHLTQDLKLSKVDEKKQLKRQKKLRQRKEKQEMKEL